ncbi:hypothetical protein E2C01_004356 [Portunus trituberculatus]|uniref:Uncharacterized protein n=1 Tax=Portunus trituberculatus TaxID=210409 RepID=A0A5B7CST4_PORTR|nr:hypothetical protein [Portunus trituberculatus]
MIGNAMPVKVVAAVHVTQPEVLTLAAHLSYVVWIEVSTAGWSVSTPHTSDRKRKRSLKEKRRKEGRNGERDEKEV